MRQRNIGIVRVRRASRTVFTAAVGGAFAPFVMLSHIASYGGSSSYAIVNSGESQRTIDEGSSNRMIRLSNLAVSAGRQYDLTRLDPTRLDPSCFLSARLGSRFQKDWISKRNGNDAAMMCARCTHVEGL